MDEQYREDEDRLANLPEHERRPEGDVGGGGGTGGEPGQSGVRPMEEVALEDEPAADEEMIPPITRLG